MKHNSNDAAGVAWFVRELRMRNGFVTGNACMDIMRIMAGDMSLIRDK